MNPTPTPEDIDAASDFDVTPASPTSTQAASEQSPPPAAESGDATPAKVDAPAKAEEKRVELICGMLPEDYFALCRKQSENAKQIVVEDLARSHPPVAGLLADFKALEAAYEKLLGDHNALRTKLLGK